MGGRGGKGREGEGRGGKGREGEGRGGGPRLHLGELFSPCVGSCPLDFWKYRTPSPLHIGY